VVASEVPVEAAANVVVAGRVVVDRVAAVKVVAITVAADKVVADKVVANTVPKSHRNWNRSLRLQFIDQLRRCVRSRRAV